MQRTPCLIVMTMALLSACTHEEQPMRIRCELSIPQAVSGSQPAMLTFALINEGSEVVHVLGWQTPFEGLRAPMFNVMRDDAELEYHGPVMKRGAPTPDHYVELKPGERKAASIDLAAGWDLSAAGNYTVEYAAELFDVVSGPKPASRSLDELTPLLLSCATVTFARQP